MTTKSIAIALVAVLVIIVLASVGVNWFTDYLQNAVDSMFTPAL